MEASPGMILELVPVSHTPVNLGMICWDQRIALVVLIRLG